MQIEMDKELKLGGGADGDSLLIASVFLVRDMKKDPQLRKKEKRWVFKEKTCKWISKKMEE
jgi:hypothetical protein